MVEHTWVGPGHMLALPMQEHPMNDPPLTHAIPVTVHLPFVAPAHWKQSIGADGHVAQESRQVASDAHSRDWLGHMRHTARQAPVLAQ